MLHNAGMSATKKSALGLRITSAREAHGINQTELARAVGVSRSAVSQWEGGVTEPSTAKMRSIALRTGVDYDWLATGRGDGPDGKSAPDLETRPTSGILEIDVRAGLGAGGSMEGREVRHDGNYSDPVKPEPWRFPAQFMRNDLRAPRRGHNPEALGDDRGDRR